MTEQQVKDAAEPPLDFRVSLMPCPFCGRKVDEDLDDTLYPTGHGWLEEGGHRHYVSYREAPKDQWCWQMLCPEVGGGCGVEIHGDSRDEAIAKWNRRANC